jgi:NADPH-dependent 2,4-dienoyl-CoA reductase/sulfur reductase-like enzyme
MKRRILVIGGLAAGPSAASKAKRISPDSDVVLYEQGEFISYGICEIPYFISNEISDPQRLVIYSPERLLKEKGVVAKTHCLVEAIIPSKKEIRVRHLNDGTASIEKYDKLIVATGSKSKQLSIEGAQARNVFTIKSLDGAYALKKFLDEEHPRQAVIIGAGFIGMEMADALAARGMGVDIIHRDKFPLSHLELDAKKVVIEELEHHHVTFHPETTVEWFGIGAKGNVVAVGTKNITIETDLVIVAIGVEPNSSLAENAGIEIGNFGGISVNDKMKALGAEDVYAAGDCCELRNIITHKPMYIALATAASKTAWIAGENATGGKAAFKGTMRAIGVRVFTKEIAHVGLSAAEAKESNFDPVTDTVQVPSKVGMMPGSKELLITLIADRRTSRLLGVNIVGEEGAVLRANVFAAAIRHGMSVDDVSQFDLIYTPPYAPLWDGILISAQHMKSKMAPEATKKLPKS